MSIKFAQELVVDEQTLNSAPEVHHHHHYSERNEHGYPRHEENAQHEEHVVHEQGFEDQGHSFEVSEPIDIEIVVEELPGAPPGTKDPEPVLEVMEEKAKEDENDAKADKKSEKWNWAARGADGFVIWIKERCEDVPKHSGIDSSGLERAAAYLEKLDAEISKAMRLDVEGELDANKIEEVRSKIDDGLARLHDRLDKVKKTKKNYKKKKADTEFEETGIVKEAQKITGVQGIYVTVPLLISRVARICINSAVSAGKNIETTYDDQVKRYKLDDREQAEVRQLIEDMGYPMRNDRGHMPEDDIDVSSSDNFDWVASYPN